MEREIIQYLHYVAALEVVLMNSAVLVCHSHMPVTESFSCLVQQVKQIMEEAVTRKFVHEDSSHIISFCGKVAQRDGL